MAEDVNSMQDSLGLDYGPPTPSVSATQPLSMPVTKHPGEASAELTYQVQAAAQPAKELLAPLLTPGTTTYNPALSGGAAGGNPANVFGAQYAANMAAIQAGYVNPYGTSMYGMGPLPGFNAGMMPTASYLTDPSYGIYRTRLPGGYGLPAYPAVPRMPLMGGPTYQGLADQMYTTPYDLATDIGMMRSAQYHGAVSSAISLPARLGIMSAGSGIGSGIGAVVGGFVGGPLGATIGGFAGGLVGGYAADSTAGEAVGKLIEKNPFTNLAQRAAQVQAITTGFVASGNNVGPSGRGVDSGSAVSIARSIRDVGYAETTGFNAADLAKIMDQGGRAGLFDSAQSVGDIKSKVMSTASVLKQFMQLTNDADISNAIKELGNMRSMGFSQHEALMATQNAKMYARNAGTSIQALQGVGQAGGMLFQGQGLSAGLGSQIGMNAYSMARQAVMTGTMTEQQLAMSGGVSGVAQNITEASASVLKVPMLTAALTRMQKNGTFAVDQDALKSFMSNKMDVFDMAQAAAKNQSEAVALRGATAIGMYNMQSAELQDQIGRAVGPVNLQMAVFNQAEMLRKRLHMPATPSGFASAAETLLGGDTQTARTVSMMAANPEFFQQQNRNLEREQAERAGARTAAFRAYVAANDQGPEIFKELRPFTEGVGRFGERFSGAMARASAALSQGAENSAYRDAGMTPFSFGPSASLQSDAEREMMTRKTRNGTITTLPPEFTAAFNREPGKFGSMSEQLLEPSAQAAYVDEKKGLTRTGFWGTINTTLRQFKRAYRDTPVETAASEMDAFAKGEERISDMYEASAAEVSKARQNRIAQAGSLQDYQEKSRQFAADFKKMAEAAGPDATFRFMGNAFGVGTPGRAATSKDFEELDKNYGGREAVQEYMMALGPNVLASGVTNTQFFHRDKAFGSRMAAKAERIAEAADAATVGMAKEIFGVDAPTGRETDAMRKMFSSESSTPAMVLAGLRELERSGTAEQRRDAAAGQYAVAQAHDFTLDASAAPVARAARLQEAMRKEVGGDKTLREIGEAALAYEGGVGAYSDMLSDRSKQFAGMLQKREDVKTGYALEQVVNPQYAGPLMAALDKGGVPQLMQAMGSLDPKAPLFQEGSTPYRAYDAYLKSERGPEDMEKFARSLQVMAPLPDQGVVGNTRDPVISGTQGNVANTAMDMGAVFSDGVRTFKDAADKIHDAAVKMENSQRRPVYAPQMQMPTGD